MNDTDTVLKGLHDSLCVRWGTSTPYALGAPLLVRKGFGGGLPFVVVPVSVPEGEVSAVIPIARQRCYSYLGEHGLGPDAVQFRPTVGDGTWYYGGRRVGLFLNDNDSATDRSGRPVPVGARKRGENLWVYFEFVRDLHRFYPDATEWPRFGAATIGQWVPNDR